MLEVDFICNDGNYKYQKVNLFTGTLIDPAAQTNNQVTDKQREN